MQQCQDQLQFNIETPRDEELVRRFADLHGTFDTEGKPARKVPAATPKARNRKSKKQKRLERLNRDTPCSKCTSCTK